MYGFNDDHSKEYIFSEKKKNIFRKKIMGLLQDKYIFALSPQY